MDQQTKKKILFVSPGFSGAAKRIISLVAQKAGPEYLIYVMTFKEPDQKPNYLQNTFLFQSNREYKETIFGKIFLTYHRSKYIRNLASEKQFNTIVGFYKQAGAPVVLSGLLNSSVKSIAAVRNNPRAKFNNLNGKITAFLYRFADQVITNSKAAKEICKNEYGIENTSSIYNPLNYKTIEKNMLERVSEEHKNIFESGKTFINIGRLSKQKGQWHLIRAFSEVVDDNPEAKLVMLGKGEMLSKLESLIDKCGLEKNVFLLGHQDNVFSYLNAADCFVLSSMHEGLPNVVLEAKAVGLPIISVDCDTGPREILAPELSYNENISYPYEAGKHTIVEPLSGSRIFENTKTNSLKPAEKSLAVAMNNKIKKGFEENKFEYDERFDPERIANKWLQIL